MVKMNFTWIKTRSAWQELEYQRIRRAVFVKDMRARMDAVNSALMGAQQSKISGIATLAAEAALKRVQEATKAKTDETIAQIDETQASLAAAKTSIDTIA